MKRLLAVSLLLIIISPNLIFAKEDYQAYLCIGEKATGLDYNKESKTWEIDAFSTHKYILTKWPDDGSLPLNWNFTGKPSWDIWDFEKKGIRLGCIESVDGNEINCTNSFIISNYFRMDINTLRFVMSSSGNYTGARETKDSTRGSTIISVGTCSGF